MNDTQKLAYALLCGVRAFAACYEDSSQTEDSNPTPRRKNEPTDDSNGIPVCHIHGKAMRISKFDENQYYCGSKLDDGKYCREKAWVE
jgi:hypothetical protein